MVNLTIIPRPGEPADSMARRFRKKYIEAGIGRDARRHVFAEKPSVRKIRKQREARRKFFKVRDASGEYKEAVAAEARRFGW